MKKLIIFLIISFLLIFSIPVFAFLVLPNINNQPQIGVGFIKVTWSEVYGADGYIFNEAYTENGIGKDVRETVYGQTYYIETNPIDNIDYSFRVKAFNQDTIGDWGTGYSVSYRIPQPLTIINKNPHNNQTNVVVDNDIPTYPSPINDPIYIEFNNPILVDLINSNNIYLKKGEETVNTYIYKLNQTTDFRFPNQFLTNIIILKPTNDLEKGVTYTVYTSNIKDIYDFTLDSEYWNFTTAIPETTIPSNDSDTNTSPISSSDSDSTINTPIIEVTPITTSNIPNSFTDIENHWAEDTIIQLINKGIYPSTETNFNPNHSINRTDFVKLLVKTLQLPLSTNEYIFTDVPTIVSDTVYIQTAYENGFIYGTSENTFSPDNPINRAEMVAIFNRVLKSKGITPTNLKSLSDFKDGEQIPEWAKQDVQNIYSLGFIAGKTSLTDVIFDYASNTTNAENATLILKLINTLNL